MTYNAVLFDLDGTLVDTSPGFIRAFQQLLVAHDQMPMDDDSIRETISDGARTTIRQGWSHDLSNSAVDGIRLQFLDLYEQLPSLDVAPYPGVPALLSQLKQQGIKVGVVTNKTQRLAPQVLKEAGLTDFIDLLICPEDLKQIKPDPEGILLAIKRLTLDPLRTLYVGDHKKDVDTAIAAGVTSIAVAYGFIPESDHPRLWGAHHIAEQPEDLQHLILNLTSMEPSKCLNP